MEELRRISIEVYQRGAEHAAERGIILADTKFEFGRHAGAEIVLGDEVLTPDSSRFWPADSYEPGRTQPSFDKQFVRDWAERAGLGQDAAGPGAAARRGRADPRQIRRGLRADHGADLLWAKARVLIRPKEGILDPQGKAVERALPALGFEGIEHVHVGRMVELEAEDPERLGELCEKLLANPLIEDYEIQSSTAA